MKTTKLPACIFFVQALAQQIAESPGVEVL